MTSLQELNRWADSLPATATMPVFFFGHGSPMNAIADNEFTRTWNTIGVGMAKPAAILAISAHWLTQGGTAVTAMQQPKTIHDFGGFPEALFEVQYPAPGSPALAELTRETIQLTSVAADHEWGLDHGTWSVLCHVFPEANIPVVQLSIDYSQGAAYHYQLGQQLTTLRNKGVLIVASGNMVHNLRMVSWKKDVDEAYGLDWALEANDTFKRLLLAKDHQRLIDWQNLGSAARLAIPTPDHYYPMMYSMGLQQDHDELSIFNDKAVMGSLTMTSYRLDAKV